MHNDQMHLIITGGNGYIGARIIVDAIHSGMTVTFMGREKPAPMMGLNFVFWELGLEIPREACELASSLKSTLLIHLAHDWQDSGDVNLNATYVLFQSARQLGIRRFLFASSQSARADSPNKYGRIKRKIEEVISGPDVISARIGLVYGGGGGHGMYGLLLKLVRLPVLPMVSPETLVQPIELGEVSSAILKLAGSELSGQVSVASKTPITFSKFLKQVARVEFGRRIWVIPVPLKLALFGCMITKWIPGIPSVDKERVLGLVGTMPMEISAQLGELGIAIADGDVPRLSSTSTGRRGLLIEANSVYRYCLGKRPSKSLLRLYIKGVMSGINESIHPVGINFMILQWPLLFRFIESFGGIGALSSRLRLAKVLGANILWRSRDDDHSNRFYVLIRLTFSLIVDCLAFPFRLVLSNFYK